MDKTKKIIIIVAIVVFTIAIGIIITMVVLNNKKEGTIYKKSDGTVEVLPEPEMELEYTQKELREPTEFFSIEKRIQNNVDGFSAQKMNYLQGQRIMTYSVYGRINSEDNSEALEKYYIFRVDLENMTYELEEIEDGVYENIDQIKLENDETEIPNKGNNAFKYEAVSNVDMCRKYLEDFKQKELNNPEEAYSMLDEEYRNERFPTFEEFQEYVNSCRDMIQYSSLSKYDVEIKDNYTEYILVDNYNNSYTIRTTGIWDYTILLDNYTIKVDTYEEEYNKSSIDQKIQANVYIFLQMINTKDYSHAYELLDETFRNNNFDTLDKFKEYVNTNFFNYNLNTTSNVDISNEGSTYIYETKIRSGAGSAAETKNLTVIMQLKEGTDFVMSFSLE